MKTQSKNLVRRTAVLVLAYLVFAVPVYAISLDEYREHVKRTITALDSLAQTDEEESTENYAQRSAETLKAV
ncbi:MAG TPA: hypothetical protein VIT88_12425, partial [Pyrinomonadaceae bacterium]